MRARMHACMRAHARMRTRRLRRARSRVNCSSQTYQTGMNALIHARMHAHTRMYARMCTCTQHDACTCIHTHVHALTCSFVHRSFVVLCLLVWLSLLIFSLTASHKGGCMHALHAVCAHVCGACRACRAFACMPCMDVRALKCTCAEVCVGVPCVQKSLWCLCSPPHVHTHAANTHTHALARTHYVN